jgi:hypothetical protein
MHWASYSIWSWSIFRQRYRSLQRRQANYAKLRFNVHKIFQTGFTRSRIMVSESLSLALCVGFRVLCPDSHVSFSQKFPEVYTCGNAPGAFGDRDPERKLGFPCYRYGWVISRAELYEALHGKPCRYDRYLYRIHVGASARLDDLWTEKGYDDNEYKWVFLHFVF